jgi:hypothetical protein
MPTWSRPGTNNPLFSPTSFPHGGRRPYVESMRRRGAAIPFGSGGLNAAEAEEGEGAPEPRCRREAQVEPRRLGGMYKWNRHAERGVGGEGKYGTTV